MNRVLLATILPALLGLAGAAPAAPKEPVFVLVPKSVVHPYWAKVRKGMEAGAKRLGVKAVFDGPTTNDLTRQIEIIEGYMARRVSGIAISPNDPRGIAPIISKAVRRGIPVVTFDSDAPGSERAMYIGTVNTDAGREAGRALVKALGGKGTVAILHGSVTALNLRERLDGFREVVDAQKGIQIVALEENRDDAALALSQAESLLTRYPALSGFYATSAPGAPAAVTALKAKGKVGQVAVVGFDLDAENLKSVEKGWITAIIEQRPARMGELAVEWLHRLSKREKPGMRIVDTGVEVVTKENAKAAAGLL